MEVLPEVNLRGRRIRSTYPALHAATLPYATVDFETFARTLGEVDRELYSTQLATGRELPTLERFAAFATRLGIAGAGLAEALTRTQMDAIKSTAHYLPHHPRILGQLHSRFRLGVCSNFSHTPTALEILRRAGLDSHLDAIVISEEIGIRKPRAEIFAETLRRLASAAVQTVHVGDALDADVSGAANAGLTPIWLTRRIRDPEARLAEHTGPRPAHVIDDLAELADVLDGLPARAG